MIQVIASPCFTLLHPASSCFTLLHPLHPASLLLYTDININVFKNCAKTNTPLRLTINVNISLAMNRKMLGKLLKSVGHVCDEANDGDVAVAKAKSEHEAGRKYDAV